MNKTLVQGMFLLLIAFFLVSCTSSSADDALTVKKERLLLATTTSTYDSGLLDYLLPVFQEKCGIPVEVISVGTGQAIANGERGDVDIILVHAPESELAFVKQGYGIDRRCVMYNDFVIVGPENDPPKINGSSLEDALTKISMSDAGFISRGDDSGTHKKEKQLWDAYQIETQESSWYLETGSGMGETLRIADEKQAYTLSDRGTYLAQKDSLGLVVLVQGDDLLLNPYGVIRVNPELHKNVNSDAAILFEDWLMSDETQERIGEFKKNGEVLFFPLRGECLGD
ncbi:MAG: substrate-binding domain-containing protein [Nanoarchaeota archaeon]